MTTKTVRMRVTESLNGPFLTRDALLTTPTVAESAANARQVAEMMELDLGAIWAGVLQSPNAAGSFDALPADIQAKLLDKYGKKAQQLADYAKASGASSLLESVTTITDRRAQARDGAQAAGAMRDLIRSMNRAHAEFHDGGRLPSGPTPRDTTAATVRSINEQNARYWAERNGRR